VGETLEESERMEESNEAALLEKELSEGMPSEVTEKLDRLIGDKFTSVLSRALVPAIERIMERKGHSDEIAGMVQLLAAKSDDAKEEVLRKALTLYGLALDQREKGNRLAFLDGDDTIVHEVVGLESVGRAEQQTALSR
jgi:hypothetical protein